MEEARQYSVVKSKYIVTYIMNTQSGRSVKVVYNEDDSVTLFQTTANAEGEQITQSVTIDATTVATIAEEAGWASVEYEDDE